MRSSVSDRENAPSATAAGAAIAFVAMLVIALLVQLMTGAYTSDLTTGADDPAHFVSALMIRDYIASGLGESPIAFAHDYYAHYPKVGIGNWPPVFHAAQAVWMLILPARPASALLLVGVTGALTAWIVFRIARPLLGAPFAMLGAAAFLVLPPVPFYLGSIMAEIPLTLLCTLAVVSWSRFLDRRGARWLAAFAALVVLAILTKVNGLLLVLVPPLSIAISGRWRLIREPVLWRSAAIVLVLTVPWIWWYLPTMMAGWELDDRLVGDVGEAMAYYAVQLPRRAGYAAIALAAVGMWSRLRRRPGGQPDGGTALWACAAAMIAATLVFHLVAPAGNDVRHLIPSYPFIALFAAAGAQALAAALRRVTTTDAVAPIVAVAAAALVLFEALPVRDRRLDGFGSAAEWLAAPASAADTVVALVAADAQGEGALVAEMAALDPDRPRHVVWRATKLLSKVTWAGRDYVERATSDAELIHLLERAGVESVVTDRSHQAFPHQRSLERAIAANPDRFVLRRRLPVRRDGELLTDGILIYDFRAGPGDGAATRARLRQVPGYLGIEPALDSLTVAGPVE